MERGDFLILLYSLLNRVNHSLRVVSECIDRVQKHRSFIIAFFSELHLLVVGRHELLEALEEVFIRVGVVLGTGPVGISHINITVKLGTAQMSNNRSLLTLKKRQDLIVEYY